MKTDEITKRLANFDHAEVMLQLPDNEPPVDFTIEEIDGLLIIFPTPPLQGHVWRHAFNINEHEPE